MALIIAFINKSNLADVSDYQVDIYVNERHIAGPYRFNGHKRSDGWQKLVKDWAEKLPTESF